MKILFSGGGTLGPVVPLLAIKESVQKKYPTSKFVWVGTTFGPEQKIIAEHSIPFFGIYAGKFRRYLSLENILDVFKVTVAYFQSLKILLKEKPNLVVTAGGFVSVPVNWAAWTLGIPTWVHQQDALVGLANRLMFPVATVVTVVFESSAKQLLKYKARWVGNPCRNVHINESDKQNWYSYFKVSPVKPVILVVGGGTGAVAINNMLFASLKNIPAEYQIIHVLGAGKSSAESKVAAEAHSNYHPYEFLKTEILGALAVADVVVSRAGMSTLTELAELKKPAIIFPKTETHQEQNSKVLKVGQGIVELNEDTDSGQTLANCIVDLVNNKEKSAQMANRLSTLLPRATESSILEIVEEVSKK